MKQYSKWLFKLTVVVIVFCLPVLAHAQCLDPLGNPIDCPIDGGLSFLLAAGVVYGVKKVRDSRKKKQAEENI